MFFSPPPGGLKIRFCDLRETAWNKCVARVMDEVAFFKGVVPQPTRVAELKDGVAQLKDEVAQLRGEWPSLRKKSPS